MTCRDAIDLLCDYVETSLTPELVATLERHLADCPPCRAYLNTYRRTRELTSQAARPPMPEEMKVRLRRFLLERFTSGRS